MKNVHAGEVASVPEDAEAAGLSEGVNLLGHQLVQHTASRQPPKRRANGARSASWRQTSWARYRECLWLSD
jgi:hypothetical protein